MKSGALTAFAALALMASHGVYAAPKGRSLSAMSKLFAHKTLALAKTHPKKSIFFGALGALSSYALYRRAAAQERAYLMEIMNTFFDSKKSQGNCGPLAEPVQNLKEVVEKASLDKNALKNLKFLMIALSGFKNEDAVVKFTSLAEAMGYAKKAMSENDLKDAVGGLMSSIKTLLGEKFLEAIEDVTKALEKKSLNTLVDPFKSLADAVKKNINKGLEGDTFLSPDALRKLEPLMRHLRDLEDTDSAAYGLICLADAMGYAKKAMGEKELKDAAGGLIKPLKVLFEKKFSETIEGVTKALGKGSLSALVDPFNDFASAVRKNINSSSLNARNLSSALWNLEEAAKKRDLAERLYSATYILGKIAYGPLKSSAQALKAAIQKKINELRENK